MNPDVFGLSLSLALLVGIVVGGVGSEFGPVIGGLFIVWIPQLAEKLSAIHIGSFQMPSKPDVFYGILLILIIFFMPSGAVGLIMRGVGRYRSIRVSSRGEAATVVPVAGVLEEEVLAEGEPGEISN